MSRIYFGFCLALILFSGFDAGRCNAQGIPGSISKYETPPVDLSGYEHLSPEEIHNLILRIVSARNKALYLGDRPEAVRLMELQNALTMLSQKKLGGIDQDGNLVMPDRPNSPGHRFLRD